MQAAQLRPCGVPRVIAVLEKIARRVRSARAKIDREHGLRASPAAPVDEFVGAESIRFRREPGETEAARALGERADAVFPVVAGHEVAAGIADDRGAQLVHELQHVFAKAMAIGTRMSRFVETSIDAAAEMLDE